MRILGLIPARGGSKGIPKKNIKLLNGKPLIRYTIESALKSKELSKVIVSTENKEIAELSIKLGAEIPFMRPAELATDDSPTIHTILHVIKELEKQKQYFDAVCLLQPTCPLRTSKFIDRCIDQYKKTNSTCLISVRKVPHQYNPYWVFEEKNDGYLEIAKGKIQMITRRQDLPQSYYRDGYVYITDKDTVINNSSMYGDRIDYICTDDPDYINIDLPSDWELAEKLIPKLSNSMK